MEEDEGPQSPIAVRKEMLADPLDSSTHTEGLMLSLEVSAARFLLRSATLNESLNRLNGECKRVRGLLKKCI